MSQHDDERRRIEQAVVQTGLMDAMSGQQAVRCTSRTRVRVQEQDVVCDQCGQSSGVVPLRSVYIGWRCQECWECERETDFIEQDAIYAVTVSPLAVEN